MSLFLLIIGGLCLGRAFRLEESNETFWNIGIGISLVSAGLITLM